MYKLQNYLLYFSLLFWTCHLFSLEKLTIPRGDHSLIEAYVTIPLGEDPFPLILLVQGSDSESVYANHDRLSQRFNPQGIGLVSMEKRGINIEGTDHQQFIEHDFFEDRIRDYFTLLTALENGLIPRWNKTLIILGGSEGGKIAPRLALQFSKYVGGIVLVGSGGGIPFADELEFQIEASLCDINPIFKFCYKIRDMLIPHQIETQYIKMLAQPDSLEMWHHKTYRWWASYLKYDPLPEMLQVNAPIYMIHGGLDLKIPIESADAVKAAFDEASKHNLTYARYMDLEHAIRGRDDVYLPMIEWIKSILFRPSSPTAAPI